MITLIITHIVAFFGGAIGWSMVGNKVQQFKAIEIAAITSKVEALQGVANSDYSRIKQEWTALLSNDKAKVASASTALKNIITQVKTI